LALGIPLAGCAQLPHTEACTTDGRPVVPAATVRLLAFEYEAICTRQPELASSVTIKISSGLWPALAAIGAAAVPFLLAEEPPLAPEPTPLEMAIPPSRLQPAQFTTVEGVPFSLNSMGAQWAQFECGGIFEADWCP
jgi:hypothetical protein